MRAMKGTHKATGETALLQRGAAGFVLAQFDRIDHRHSHGWHTYRRRDFRIRRR